MTTDFAIYDMDRTVTQRATYTPFLIHCAMRRAPWRLIFMPFVIGSMLAYILKIIDRGRLKEINHRLLLGHNRHPHELKPLVDSFAEKMVATNVRPGAREAIARDKAEGRRIVMLDWAARRAGLVSTRCTAPAKPALRITRSASLANVPRPGPSSA